MANKEFDKERQQPQAGQEQGVGGGRKNNEEVGEPVQLNEDMEQGQQKGQQPKKPAAGQQPEGGQPGQQGGQQQGGQQQGGQQQGGQLGGSNR